MYIKKIHRYRSDTCTVLNLITLLIYSLYTITLHNTSFTFHISLEKTCATPPWVKITLAANQMTAQSSEILNKEQIINSIKRKHAHVRVILQLLHDIDSEIHVAAGNRFYVASSGY